MGFPAMLQIALQARPPHSRQFFNAVGATKGMTCTSHANIRGCEDEPFIQARGYAHSCLRAQHVLLALPRSQLLRKRSQLKHG